MWIVYPKEGRSLGNTNYIETFDSKYLKTTILLSELKERFKK